VLASAGVVGVHGTAELGYGFGGDAEGIAYGAHDFEGGAFGLAGFEQVDGAEGDAGAGGQRALAEQLALANGCQRARRAVVHRLPSLTLVSFPLAVRPVFVRLMSGICIDFVVKRRILAFRGSETTVSVTISADDLRTIRALEIAAGADDWLVFRTADGEIGYRVPSQSDPERTYAVTASSCDCPDFQRGGLPAMKAADSAEPRACKHILAVRLFNELVRAQRNLALPASQRRPAD
jgi:hypothetical protein